MLYVLWLVQFSLSMWYKVHMMLKRTHGQHIFEQLKGVQSKLNDSWEGWTGQWLSENYSLKVTARYMLFIRTRSGTAVRGSGSRRRRKCWRPCSTPTSYASMTSGRTRRRVARRWLCWSLSSWPLAPSRREWLVLNWAGPAWEKYYIHV